MDSHARLPPGDPPEGFDPNGAEPREHPSSEVLAAYLDGQLSGAELAQVSAHVTDCADCLEVLRDSAAFLDEEPKARPRVLDWFTRRRVLAIGGSLAAAAVLVLAIRGAMGPATPITAERPNGVEELFGALARRPATARLAGLDWRPPRGVRRSAATGDEAPLDVLAAAARLEEATAGKATWDARWGAGLAQLSAGRADEAIRSLEAAAADKPGVTALETDLSAAYLARAERTGDADSARRGLELADRVLARDPAALPARFNRALALEYLDRTDEARQAWRDYLARDAASPWANEIRQRTLP